MSRARGSRRSAWQLPSLRTLRWRVSELPLRALSPGEVGVIASCYPLVDYSQISICFPRGLTLSSRGTGGGMGRRGTCHSFYLKFQMNSTSKLKCKAFYGGRATEMLRQKCSGWGSPAVDCVRTSPCHICCRINPSLCSGCIKYCDHAALRVRRWMDC